MSKPKDENNWNLTPIDYGRPAHIASPLQIMVEGPLGGAAFNNEFGRPNLLGYFREYEQNLSYTVKDAAGLRSFLREVPFFAAGPRRYTSPAVPSPRENTASLRMSMGMACFSAIVSVLSGSSGLMAIKSAPSDRITGSSFARAASSRLQYGHQTPR